MIGPEYYTDQAPDDPIASYRKAMENVRQELPGINTNHQAVIYVIRLAEAASLADESYKQSCEPDSPSGVWRDSLGHALYVNNLRRDLGLNVIQLTSILYPKHIYEMSDRGRLLKMTEAIDISFTKRRKNIASSDKYDPDIKHGLGTVLTRMSGLLLHEQPLYLPPPKALPAPAEAA